MDEEEIAKMDHEEIVAKQVEELNKEKKELQVRIDFFNWVAIDHAHID